MNGYWVRQLTLRLSRSLGALVNQLRRPIIFQLVLGGLIAVLLAAADRWPADPMSIFRRAPAVQPLRTQRAQPAGKKPAAPAAKSADSSSTRQPTAQSIPQVKAALPKDSAARPGQSAGPAAAPGNRSDSTGTTAQSPRVATSVPKPWLTWTNLLSVWAVGFLIWTILRARRQLVIGRFDDFTDKKAGLDVSGFGVLFATHLSGLNELFRETEPGQAFQSIPDRLKAVDALFQSGEEGTTLDKAVSSESSFALGPLKLPVGFVMGLVGRLVRGPQITGQIVRDGGTRIVTARITGRLGERAWRIVDPARGGELDKEIWGPAAELADELGCRVFADLALGPTARWEALQKFAAGVRAYRRSLRRPAERSQSLREAEHRLIDALAQDPGFDLAHYNLGVVYAALNQPDAAASAFERALEQNARRWSTHYALAVTNIERGMAALQRGEIEPGKLYLSKTVDHCERARRLAPDHGAVAQVLVINTLVFWWRGHQMWPNLPEAQSADFTTAARYARQAVSHAWKALCSAEAGIGTHSGDLTATRERTRGLAVRSLNDLATIQLQIADKFGVEQPGRPERPGPLQLRLVRKALVKQASRGLRQARALAPETAQLSLDLGNSNQIQRRWKASVRPLRDAARLNPTSPEAWASLALALAHLGLVYNAREATQRVWERPDLASERALNALIAANHILASFMDELDAFSERGQRIATQGSKLRMLLSLFLPFMRLSYRLAARRWVDLSSGTEALKRLLANKEERDATRAAHVAMNERAAAFASFQATVDQLTEQKGAGIQSLSVLYETQRLAGHPWEAAAAGSSLAGVYLGEGMTTEAQTCLEGLIEYLRNSLDSEIKRRGLHAFLARVLRKQQKRQEALAEARKAVEIDPLSFYERNELGWNHFELTEFAAAQQAWEKALVLRPEHAGLHVSLGLAHLRQLSESKDNAVRNRQLDTARRYLETALELYDRKEDGRNDAVYLLASVYTSAGAHPEAVRHLRSLEHTGFCPTVVKLQLADSYFSNNEHVLAEEGFQALAAQLDGEIAASNPDAPLRSPLGEEHVLGSAAAFAHLGVAGSLVSRQIRLDEALDQVAKARLCCANLKNRQLAANWCATSDYAEGWILLRQDKIDPAILKLESALSVGSIAELYLVLAEALARRVEIAGKGPAQAPTVRRGLFYCSEAERQDWTNQLTKRIAPVLARLQALAAP
jgi:tetratricopeptide (TPR) repeat protein